MTSSFETKLSNMKKYSLLIISLIMLNGCLVDYYRDWAINLQVSGKVKDAETNTPLPGTRLIIESNRLLGEGKSKEIALSDSNGEISGCFERKWGLRQNALSVWSDKVPIVDLRIRLLKEQYKPLDFYYRLDKTHQISGNVPISLGTISLEKDSDI